MIAIMTYTDTMHGKDHRCVVRYGHSVYLIPIGVVMHVMCARAVEQDEVALLDPSVAVYHGEKG